MLNVRGVVIGLILVAANALGAESSDRLHDFYQNNPHYSSQPLGKKLQIASQYFLGQPYVLGPLGEGKTGKYDQGPLYRSDAFDCVTYVETVLALAQSSNFSEFVKKLQSIRYRDGKVDFMHRNHFTSLDWNPNNAKNGVQDITTSILNEQKKPIAIKATALIDKPAWYRHFTSQDIKTSGSPKEKENLALQLQDHGHFEEMVKTTIYYLPFSALLDKNGKIVDVIQKQIPNGSIIEIVRPNWDLTRVIGTHLHISHLGFAFRTPKGLIFRNASSTLHKVADVPLDQYLQEARKNPTIQGIMVLSVR